MTHKAISLIGVSKAYQLGVFNKGSFYSDVVRWWALKRGREDPFLKIGEENDRTSKGKSKIVWSLKDLTFDVDQGDSVGIVGRNGAGKSTLLKVLSQVTEPTTGKMKIRGKVASLLEVGTGFHPELTGRDNIFLNGAIMGMRKEEIKRKFDEIVSFSGVERYIDTPVKRYSSGMYVRLAFAVAAHLESDILIVDEVLAVGDADFQRKCLGKMNEIGESTGRTILFVSHNMSSIKALCSKAIFMDKGKIINIGGTQEIISQYLKSYAPIQSNDGTIEVALSRNGTGEGKFTKFLPVNLLNEAVLEFFFGEQITFVAELEIERAIEDAIISIQVTNIYGETISMIVDENYRSHKLETGKVSIRVELLEILMPGEYSFNLGLYRKSNGANIDFIESVGRIKVLKDSIDRSIDYPWPTIHGYFKPKSKWVINKL